jgi:hypothetical protein
MCVIRVLRKTKYLRTLAKSKGAADRHIGCAQHDRPSTGGGGKGWPAALTKRDGIFCSAWAGFNGCALQHTSKIFADLDHDSVNSRKPRNGSPRQMLEQR